MLLLATAPAAGCDSLTVNQFTPALSGLVCNTSIAAEFLRILRISDAGILRISDAGILRISDAASSHPVATLSENWFQI